jgi:hypothetical protein
MAVEYAYHLKNSWRCMKVHIKSKGVTSFPQDHLGAEAALVMARVVYKKSSQKTCLIKQKNAQKTIKPTAKCLFFIFEIISFFDKSHFFL